MEKIAYLNQPNCLKLSNGTVEVIVTTDVGPRIARYGFVDGENILGEVPDAGLTTELGDWKAYGGHRLWAAPENNPRTYVPDNSPVEHEELGERSVRLIGPVEEPTGLQKETIVTLDADGTGVTVEHSITNCGLWPIELAPWAITIMNGEGGGTVVIPQEPYIPHDDELLPARPMVLWHYTDLSDPRWTLGKKFIRLNVDASLAEPQKVGVANKQGWAAYSHNGLLFVKMFDHQADAAYADEGCNCETYTAGSFVEVETLGTMFHLVPGESADHAERWQLFKDVTLGETDDEVEAALKPLLGAEEA
jgi:hypothetical protein